MKVTLLQRADMLPISRAALAARAGIGVEALRLCIENRSKARHLTVLAVEAALIAEERRVLAHLLALHPDLSPPAARNSASPPATAPLAGNGHGALSSQTLASQTLATRERAA